MADFARSDHPDVQAQLDRLSKVSPAGDRLGLERVAVVLEKLGRPQDALPPVFHVAGTNGKGSTVAFLRAALEAAGHKVHVFTSPHLVRFNERIRVAGQLIDDATLAAALEEVIAAGEEAQPSFFEVATAAAMLVFARNAADACILEVGLGGRLDATNVIERPLVTGITNLGLDHQQYLGQSLPEIAGEKAAIAKQGVPLVTQLYPAAAASRIGEVAHERGARWLPRGSDWDAIDQQGKIRYHDGKGELVLPLPRLQGRHQALNAALAVAMLRHQQELAVAATALSAAMGWADWPARLQRLSAGPLVGDREVWLDGGHNASAARQVASFVKHKWNDGRPLEIVFASLTTKDPRAMLEPFAGLAAMVRTVRIPDHACFSPDDLTTVARELGFAAEAYDDVHAALDAVAETSRVLIFGSLYLAGSVLTANDQIPD